MNPHFELRTRLNVGAVTMNKSVMVSALMGLRGKTAIASQLPVSRGSFLSEQGQDVLKQHQIRPLLPTVGIGEIFTEIMFSKLF